MGRSLSPLHRWILDRAADGRRVYYVDVLEGYFGWKPVIPIRRHPAGDDTNGTPGEIIDPGAQYISQKELGEPRYHREKGAVGRACLRLQDCGLVERLRGQGARWSALVITEQGKEWLSVSVAAQSQAD
jgi:hypothetical protein